MRLSDLKTLNLELAEMENHLVRIVALRRELRELDQDDTAKTIHQVTKDLRKANDTQQNAITADKEGEPHE